MFMLVLFWFSNLANSVDTNAALYLDLFEQKVITLQAKVKKQEAHVRLAEAVKEKAIKMYPTNAISHLEYIQALAHYDESVGLLEEYRGFVREAQLRYLLAKEKLKKGESLPMGDVTY